MNEPTYWYDWSQYKKSIEIPIKKSIEIPIKKSIEISIKKSVEKSIKKPITNFTSTYKVSWIKVGVLNPFV